VTARSIRDRLRAEITEEILDIARRHLAVEGANLSLRAVARELGMVPSALYRYFPSRDALLTRLITDAYDMLGAAAEAAEAQVPREDRPGRWLALARGVRAWGLANPAEYALIYGSPVPGYAAPQDTVAPASRVIMALLAILLAAAAAATFQPGPTHPIPAALAADLAELTGQWQGPLPDLPQELIESVLVVGLMMWTQLFGLVNHEVFGRLDDMIAARGEYFDHQVRLLGVLVGLG
jgi:AcrR family transcriptional regulator